MIGRLSLCFSLKWITQAGVLCIIVKIHYLLKFPMHTCHVRTSMLTAFDANLGGSVVYEVMVCGK